MPSLGERIKYIRDGILKLNQAEFAEMLGFSRVATISDYEKNKRSPDIQTLCKIAGLGAVSLDWLLVGEGDISIPAEKKAIPIKESLKPIYCEECLTVEVYNIAEAGSPKEFPKGEPIDSVCIPKRDYKEGIIAVKVQGDSMSPTILDGSIVGIDTKDRRLISGKLYAVWLKYEGITIKRVFVDPEKVVIKPDNPNFPETAIPVMSIGEEFIIGRVKWIYQRC